jgi:hypothetical protein
MKRFYLFILFILLIKPQSSHASGHTNTEGWNNLIFGRFFKAIEDVKKYATYVGYGFKCYSSYTEGIAHRKKQYNDEMMFSKSLCKTKRNFMKSSSKIADIVLKNYDKIMTFTEEDTIDTIIFRLNWSKHEETFIEFINKLEELGKYKIKPNALDIAKIDNLIETHFNTIIYCMKNIPTENINARSANECFSKSGT